MKIHSLLWRESMLFIDVLTVSPATLLLVSPELCVNYFGAAAPPHDLLAGVLDTALLPSTGDGSPGLHLVAPEW